MKNTKNLPKLTPTQKRALARAMYILKVAAFTDIVNEDRRAVYDGTNCDGYCFKEDAKDSAAELEYAFGKMKMPEDCPVDEDEDGWM